MSRQVISETAHAQDFERLITRLSEIVETENRALENGDMKTLKSLQEEKSRLSYFMKKKWHAYSPMLKKGDGNNKRANAFATLSPALEDLKQLMKKNHILLNAAKVRSANRIEAGMQAWKRLHADQATSYGMDGSLSGAYSGPNATTSRLI